MAPNTSELEELLYRARLMDPLALGQLHDQYYPQIYRYIYFRLGNELVSQELTDEVIHGMFDQIQKSLHFKNGLEGWLLKITATHVQAYIRGILAVNKQDIPNEENFPAEESTPSDTIWGLKMVQNAFSQLLPDEQHFLAMRFALALSLDDIAKKTGSKPAELIALQFHSLQSLRCLLESVGNG